VADYLQVRWVKSLECPVLGGVLSQNGTFGEQGEDLSEPLFLGKSPDTKKELVAGDTSERVPDPSVGVRVQVGPIGILEGLVRA